MTDADLVRDVGGLGPPASSPPPASPVAAGDESAMSLVEHLSELRRRIAISLLAIFLGSLVGFYFAPQLITFLTAPPNLAKTLVYTGLGDAFFINLKIAIVVGIVIAMPVLVWQLWRFISPGLTREERRMARPWAPLAIVFFVMGAKVGIITSARLRRSRRVVILAIAIISAVVTPGGDPISPTVLGVTMYLLYEFSIVLIRFGGR